MQITSKGQVIALASERPGSRPAKSDRGRLVLEALRGTADTRMSTDQIMALTRGGARSKKERK